ncbi:HD-GYP domain-containing protein [Pelotomaculum isophthalicicum JI]|uniref:HD-GYP domain-containing protein n=1 Tax=Pelotomaculum isophthalicicum JI TaxID=947010 RepID=A0A9X4H1N0_9FIRM|nr:HD-GYP domain-containing protein [Pelotomaculum isophthalicicum]MDF9408286.1 HD-GYP domain-containing protein [Pelotomaculum isophthalicicum JI]
MLEELNNLVKMISIYSLETYQHSVNVGIIATRIGNFLGLPEKQVSLIKYAGLLHDIGKTKIDLKILNKPGKLTTKEFNIIKKHTEYGVKILSSYPWTKPFLQLVNLHHERWDGNGYNGIHGPDIPIGARILALADAFDAMSSCRPYSPIKSMDQIINELDRFSGAQFDPHLVEKVIQASDKVLLKDWDGVV